MNFVVFVDVGPDLKMRTSLVIVVRLVGRGFATEILAGGGEEALEVAEREPCLCFGVVRARGSFFVTKHVLIYETNLNL